MGRRRPRLRRSAAGVHRRRRALRRHRRRHRGGRRPGAAADGEPDRSRRLGSRHRHQPERRVADAEGGGPARPGDRRPPRRGVVDDRLRPSAAAGQLRREQGRGGGHGRRRAPRDARSGGHGRQRPSGHLPYADDRWRAVQPRRRRARQWVHGRLQDRRARHRRRRNRPRHRTPRQAQRRPAPTRARRPDPGPRSGGHRAAAVSPSHHRPRHSARLRAGELNTTPPTAKDSMSTSIDAPAATTTLALPLTLPNGAEIKNRLGKAAMSEQLGAPANGPTAALARAYRRWARGGVGLIITGNVMIDRRSIGEPLNVVVEDNRDIEELRRWAAAARTDGATALAQINHPGRQTLAGLSELAVAPSAVKVDMGPAFARPRALTAEEILGLIARFARSAGIAVDAGFDGVQVHAAHGYLVNQFLSPHTNRRDDEWGGDPERRRRFLLDVTRAIRAAIGPDKVLSIKLNSADFQRGGFTEDESLAVIEHLDRESIDLLEISGGTYESPAMSDGGTEESTRLREAFFLDFAKRVRGVTTVPLLVTRGFRTGPGMTDAITSGATDLVGIARPLALQPELPTALLASPDTARSDFELKKIGIKKLDSVADLWWTQHQIQRLGAGKDPDPAYGPRRAVLDALRRDGRNILRRRRGA